MRRYRYETTARSEPRRIGNFVPARLLDRWAGDGSEPAQGGGSFRCVDVLHAANRWSSG
jgi:hypothetical protein